VVETWTAGTAVGVLPDISGVWGVGGGLVVVSGLDSGLDSEVRDLRSAGWGHEWRVGFLVRGCRLGSV
jgi:hypothetical protein